MSPPFELTDWSTAGQGSSALGDLAMTEPASYGCRGFTHKATEGRSYKDPSYWRRRDRAEDLGYRYRGPYHWLSPTSGVDEQLNNFRAYVANLREGECIQLDCEQAGLSKALIRVAYDAWRDTYGDRIIVYTGAFFTGGTQRTPIINDLPGYIDWWLAWYGPASFARIEGRLPRRPVVWQWGGGAEGQHITMLGRRVDSNQVLDATRLEELSGYAPFEPIVLPAPPILVPVPVPVPIAIPVLISVPTPAPAVAWAAVPEEEDLPNRIGPLFIQATGADGTPAGTVYLCDGRGMMLRRITDEEQLADVRWQLTDAGYPADLVNAPPTSVNRVASFGHVVNP